MVSDADLVSRLRQFLSTSDLNTTTNATVRRQLEADFGIDLSDRKAFLREQINLYLEQAQAQNAEKEEEERPAEKIKSEESDGGGEQESAAAAENEVEEGEEESEETEEEEVEGDEELKKTSNGRKAAKKRCLYQSIHFKHSSLRLIIEIDLHILCLCIRANVIWCICKFNWQNLIFMHLKVEVFMVLLISVVIYEMIKGIVGTGSDYLVVAGTTYENLSQVIGYSSAEQMQRVLFKHIKSLTSFPSFWLKWQF